MLFLKLGSDSPGYRAFSRKAILVELVVLAIACIAALSKGIVLFVLREPCLYIVSAVATLMVDMLLLSWFLAKVVSATNGHFFDLVEPVDDSRGGTPRSSAALKDLVDSRSGDVLRSAYFLLMLIDPAVNTMRIGESIVPRAGFFHVDTEYEMTVPRDLRGADVVMPASFQDKRELTNDLKLLDSDGRGLERLKDREARDYTARTLAIVINALTGCPHRKALEFAKAVASLVFGNSYGACREGDDPKKIEDDNANRKEKEKRDIKKHYEEVCADGNCEADGLALDLALVLHESFWRVKPICVRVTTGRRLSGTEAETPLRTLSSKGGSVILRVQQNVPLIRVRNEASDLSTRAGRWVQRRLTKRRKSFYFSLANADRADSYHLSFSGPGQSYYAESEIVTIHPDGTPLKAERMTATCRCDQVDSRLYVKGGAGLHNAALSFVYEDTNHRSLQTICVSTAICFALICFTAFRFILPFDSLTGITEKDTSLQIVAIFFSVMTFAGLMSVWESLSGQRSEEWVWVSASVTMASSLIGLADLIYLITSNGTLGLFFHQVLWSLLVLVEFSIFILVLISLFYKVKLHSSFMARVPLTRSLVRDASSGKRDAKKGAPHANKSDEKKGKKKFDEAEMYYEDLVGCYWADGWLVPTWVALVGASKDEPHEESEESRAPAP